MHSSRMRAIRCSSHLLGGVWWGDVCPRGCLYVSPKNKQMAHNQVYNRQIGLRPSQHMLVLPSVQSA